MLPFRVWSPFGPCDVSAELASHHWCPKLCVNGAFGGNPPASHSRGAFRVERTGVGVLRSMAGGVVEVLTVEVHIELGSPCPVKGAGDLRFRLCRTPLRAE